MPMASRMAPLPPRHPGVCVRVVCAAAPTFEFENAMRSKMRGRDYYGVRVPLVRVH